MRFAIVILLCLVPQSSGRYFEETFSGTILAWEATNERVIAMADSRLMKEVNGLAVPAGDNGCKIIGLSKDSFFFYSGLAEFGRSGSGKPNQVIFSAHQIAKQVYRKIAEEPNSTDKLKKLAVTWAKLMKPKLDDAFAKAPTNRPETPLGGFGGLDSKKQPVLIIAKLFISTGMVPTSVVQATIDQIFLTNPSVLEAQHPLVCPSS
jgi:hypothetical protein